MVGYFLKNASKKYCLNMFVPYQWAHKNGVFYEVSVGNVPSGAFYITDEEKTLLNAAIEDGGTLLWYENQRPYVCSIVTWTQPVLTSNTTVTEYGIIYTTASSDSTEYNAYDIWRAMDGRRVGSTRYEWCSADTTFPQWWQVVFPYNITITGIKFYNPYLGSSANKVQICQFFTSSSMTTAIGDSFTTTNANWATIDVEGIPVVGITTNTVYAYFPGGAATTRASIGELTITAQLKHLLYEVENRANLSCRVSSYYLANID